MAEVRKKLTSSSTQHLHSHESDLINATSKNITQEEEAVDEEVEIVTVEATMVLPMGHLAHGNLFLLGSEVTHTG